VAIFHVEGVTPNSRDQYLDGLEKVHIGHRDIKKAKESLTTGKEPDLIAVGCPHLSQMEMKMLASMLDGKRPRSDSPEVWFCLERFGKVVCDTCMIVAPIESRHRCTATNSAKACNYLPSLCSQKVVCGSYAELMERIA
jgi:predicted aconitase